MKSNSCTHYCNMILWNALGCIPQPHLAKVSSVPGSYCNRPNRSVACSLHLWPWFWRWTLNGTTWLRWYTYKALTSSLSTILWLTVLCLIILAEYRKQGNETLSNAIQYQCHTRAKTMLFQHSSADDSVKC